jgi:phage gp16-like protein
MRIKLQIGKKLLGLDDDTYRAMLELQTGRRSSRDLNGHQLHKVIQHMESRGAVFTNRHPKRITPAPEREAMMGKIHALLADKAQRQGSPVPWRYADALAKRVCKVDAVDFCTGPQLRKVIAALEYDKKRDDKQEAEA